MRGHSISMLGTGLIGEFYTQTLHRPRSRDRVAVVYSRTVERGKAFSERWGIPSATTDLEEAIRHPDADLVVVGLPNHLHEEAIALCPDDPSYRFPAGVYRLAVRFTPYWRVAEGEGFRSVYSFEDRSASLVGSEGEGRGPDNLRRTGLADWLLERDPVARVVSVSGQDRSAIATSRSRCTSTEQPPTSPRSPPTRAAGRS
jgi:hypothetical protein